MRLTGDKKEINITGITDKEMYWLHNAIKYSQNYGDADDVDRVRIAERWLDISKEMFRVMRPS